MSGFVRRVVTGHDKEGKSIVISDGIAPAEHHNPMVPGQRSSDVWKTTAMPVPLTREEPDPTNGPRDFVAPMGTKIRISEVPPETADLFKLTPEQTQAMFRNSGSQIKSTYKEGGRHPRIHRTESIDYAVVLEGEVTMVLDVGEVHLKTGDVVIQRGTNHAWSNRSDAPAAIAFILVDGEFDPALAQSLARFSAS